MERKKSQLCFNCGVARYQSRGKWESDLTSCVKGMTHNWVTPAEFIKLRRVPRDTPPGTWSAAEAYQLHPGKKYETYPSRTCQGDVDVKNELGNWVTVSVICFTSKKVFKGANL